MIHASGVSESGTGRIFSGFSGVGKSTMAKLWEKEGSLLINDDRLIIRQRGDDFYIHNTPMPYRDIPKVSRLDAIYLPYHAPANKMEPLSLLKAVSKVMAYCIIHGYNKEHLEHHLAFLTRLCSKLPVSLLGVVPDRQVIPFIKAGETKDTVDQP